MMNSLKVYLQCELWIENIEEQKQLFFLGTDFVYVAVGSSVKLTSQILTFEHEGNWSKALEYYDLQVRIETLEGSQKYSSHESSQETSCMSISEMELGVKQRKPYKGVTRSLQQIGCAHILDLYCQGLASRRQEFQHDQEFVEQQVALSYEWSWWA